MFLRLARRFAINKYNQFKKAFFHRQKTQKVIDFQALMKYFLTTVSLSARNLRKRFQVSLQFINDFRIRYDQELFFFG